MTKKQGYLVAFVFAGLIALALGISKWKRWGQGASARRDLLANRAEALFLTSETARGCLGESLQVDALGASNLHEEGNHGRYELDIAVHGKAKKGLLFVAATESNGNWTVSSLALQPAEQEEWVNLVSPAK